MDLGLASGLAIVSNEEIYYIGNFNVGGVTPAGVYSSDLYKYSNAWEALAPLPAFTPRSGHCGCGIGGEIYVFGGQKETEEIVFDTSFRINPTEQTCVNIPSLPEPRHSGTCTVYNSQALIWGGANEEGVLDSLVKYSPGKM
jgi:N-acetylneuraminic acid mutarotase